MEEKEKSHCAIHKKMSYFHHAKLEFFLLSLTLAVALFIHRRFSD
jgi:hypothetical protein